MSSEATIAELRQIYPGYEGVTAAALRRHFEQAGVPVDDLLASGQLLLKEDSDAYLRDGKFDPERMKSQFRNTTEEALADGWAGLYALGNMAWARTPRSGVEQLHTYERGINGLLAECKHFIGLCLYDRGIFSPGELCKVLQSHPQAAVGNEYFARNFYYNPPNYLYEDDPKRLRLENWLANLRERKQLDKQLEDRTIELHLKNLELQRELNQKAKLEHEKHLAELASEQKSLFVSTLSHEIRTPLHGIMTAAMLLNSMDLGAEAQEYTKLVQVSSMHLQSVVNDVLSMSLLETGKVTVENERFHLRDAVHSTLKMVTLGDAALGKRFTISLNDLPADEVEGDRKKLTQVLLNLLSNSAKFTGDDGAVSVTARVLQPAEPIGLAEFCVTDNGIGIPPEKLAHVCRPFYQIDQGNTRRFSGLGLGLSVCNSLIEVLKGRFTIHSEGIGKGTSCTFTFPLRKASAATVDSVAPTLPHQPASSTIDVLLVEDNRLNAAITTRLLHRLGIKRVTAVEDGMSAVEATRDGNFDLVLMDLHMPGKLDGFEAARLIRIIMETRVRRARVVALTANVSNEVRQRCEQEMDGYIAKPLSLAQLVAALRAVELHTPQTTNSAAS